jgi:hypothetical protein
VTRILEETPVPVIPLALQGCGEVSSVAIRTKAVQAVVVAGDVGGGPAVAVEVSRQKVVGELPGPLDKVDSAGLIAGKPAPTGIGDHLLVANTNPVGASLPAMASMA